MHRVRAPALDLLPILAATAVLLLPRSGLSQDSSAEPSWSAALGLITIPGHGIYSGRVGLRFRGVTSGGRYSETTDLSVGLQARAFVTSGRLGDVSLSAYGTRTTSTGFYTGIGPEKTLERDIFTLGVDLGWEPSLWNDRRASLRIPFGPSVVWQTLDLSSGHRDEYADPIALGSPPRVSWSDRTWFSFGGYAGLGLLLNVSEHVGLAADGTARFLWSDKGGWAGQEERDILQSTGNTVTILYEESVIFLWTARVGLLWHP